MAPGTLTLKTTCTGGINQNPERCRDNQVADALNVWAPNGRLEQRPGCRGISYLGRTTGGASVPGANIALAAEDVSAGTITGPAAGVLALATLQGRDADVGAALDGDRWYFGVEAITNAIAFYAAIAGGNIAPLRAEVQYWNGSSWVALSVSETTLGAQPVQMHLDIAGSFFVFVPPADWSTSVLMVGGVATTRYWMRFTLVAIDPTPGGTVALSAGTAITLAGCDFIGLPAARENNCVYIGRAVFPTFKSYISITLTGAGYTGGQSIAVFSSTCGKFGAALYSGPASPTTGRQASLALIPQFAEVFIAFNNICYRLPMLQPVATYAPTTDIVAQVEDRDFAVGPGAPWDKTTIAQLTSFPEAKFILFFQNRLWVVDKNDNLRWSAAAPYHKVWPGLAFAPVIEDDQSPVTGLQGLGENPVIYKNDSIWVASYSAIDAFDIPQYTPRKVVSGVGCVANGSIKSIKGRHIFLGENGIYSFDGSTAPLLTQDPETGVDRLREFWPRINSGRRRWAAAAHWRSKHCYLLSVSTDGADYNNTTVCWDYVNDAWWLWEGFDAQCWIEDEDEQDNEAMYFSDSYGQVYRFGIADHDHGATIEAYALTRRLGYGDSMRKTLRQLDICADNTVQSLTVTTTANGSPVQFGKTKTLDFTSRNETRLGVEGWTLSGVGTRLMAALARIRQRDTNVTCDFVQVKLAGAGRGKPLRVNYVQAKFLGHPGRAR